MTEAHAYTHRLSRRYQPPFLKGPRPLLDRVWRLSLLLGLIVWSSGIPFDAAQTHWRDVVHDLFMAGAFWLVIRFERTLDRWEPFVPPSVRGRRP